ncbi:methionyl-tRNA formyltransferase [Kaarinaea lacus]
MNNRVVTVFFGSPGPLSASVFKGLQTMGITVSHVVCAVAGPAGRLEGQLPVSSPGQVEQLRSLANQIGIPLSYVTCTSDLLAPGPEIPEHPDFILAACFPFKLPGYLLQTARIAALNIHPSLLPKYRGPDPIFWQLKYGETRTGVSLHLLSNDLDAGPVVRQKAIDFIEGAYKKDIEIQLGHEGARLFSECVKKGQWNSEKMLPQDDQAGSYHPYPENKDYRVSTTWSARHAYNFIRGTWSPVYDHNITFGNSTWAITRVLDYSIEGMQEDHVLKNQDQLYIQMSPGILHAHGYQV